MKDVLMPCVWLAAKQSWGNEVLEVSAAAEGLGSFGYVLAWEIWYQDVKQEVWGVHYC